MDDSQDLPASHPPVRRDGSISTDDFMTQFEVDDADTYMTTNAGGPIEEQESLSAGERGPTLLEDFAFREKIMHFDHERVSNVPIQDAHDTYTDFAHQHLGSRTRRSRSWCWSTRYFRFVRRLVQYHWRILPFNTRQGDPGIPPVFDSRRKPRLC
jgi:hypothetical protein